MKKRAAVSWSSGKDSAYTLFRLSQSQEYEVSALFTTYNSTTGRLPIQGTPIEAVRAQAQAIGLPLIEIDLPENCPNGEYEERVRNALTSRKREFQHLAFGDLFLDGIREYRESFLRPAGFQLVFPLMGIPTTVLSKEIISSGIRAKICSIDSTQLERKFIGRDYNEALLDELPSQVDPCGERGEFHTFVYEGPFFSKTPSVAINSAKDYGRFTFLEMTGFG